LTVSPNARALPFKARLIIMTIFAPAQKSIFLQLCQIKVNYVAL